MADWISRSFTFVSAMPRKEKKPRKKPAKKKGTK